MRGGGGCQHCRIHGGIGFAILILCGKAVVASIAAYTVGLALQF